MLPILIHGDAAFAGQGVVAETLNLSQLRGYRTGGTVHIVVNNQVGFTATAGQTRSSKYASDVAKMIEAPIFHVNGDDPEACVRVARLAFDFRQAFQKDAVIDMWCYRKWGHNEADEPSYTQPLMYKRSPPGAACASCTPSRCCTGEHLSMEQAEGALEDYRRKLQAALDQSRETRLRTLTRTPEPRRLPEPARIVTAVGIATLNRVMETITRIPEGFMVHPKLVAGCRIAAGRWSTTGSTGRPPRLWRFGSLLIDGVSIRLAGQDSRRGTFSQRHAVLIDQENGSESSSACQAGRKRSPLQRLRQLLSEFAALGFEYGYSTAATDSLTMWEAQFGDFANGAQVTIDQFIAAGEDKWEQKATSRCSCPTATKVRARSTPQPASSGS